MITHKEILDRLKQETNESITQLLAMTWHHQLRAWRRVPQVMERRDYLMERWLALHELDDAARLVELIHEFGLKDGDLPEHYDPEQAERLCRAVMRSRDDLEAKDAMRALGMR